MDIKKFRKLPIMGIVRGARADIIDRLTDVVIEAGLKTIEVTMNTPAAVEQIRRMNKAAQGELMIGAGTVLSFNEAQKAIDAGASFIVSPVLVPDVVKFCKRKKIPVFPGAFTPQEVYDAWQAGATMVKVFPATFFGPSFFKELKGPFNHIELLACGGVNPDNIRSFFSSGASAVSFGESIFKKERLNKKKFSFIKKDIQNLISAYK